MSVPRVVLGVSGGIAAYKAVEVLRLLQQAGCDVHCCMTLAATRFVGPLTFAAISGHSVSAGSLGSDADADMAHVEVTRDASLFLVAPATANTIAKLAHGIGDDWLTTHFLAHSGPVLIAPAMNQRMWANPAVRANVALLMERGARFVGPDAGDLACGEVGTGRLADPAEIAASALMLMRGAPGSLTGRRVLVTSGPTLEDIDPVRFLGNRSSGRMGHALALQAQARGAIVTLVSGPVSLPDPPGVAVVRVRSAAEMAREVSSRLALQDVVLFAAAVADFAPRSPVAEKIRREDRQVLELELERTPDVLALCVAAAPKALLVGFAAEVGGDIASAARSKLAAKGCDLVVANRVDGPGSAFDSADNEVVIAGPDGVLVSVPRAAKSVVAGRILDEVEQRLKLAASAP